MKAVENAAYLEEFLGYLKNEKRMAKNSLDAYKSDVNDVDAFLKSRGVADITKASNTDVVSYLLHRHIPPIELKFTIGKDGIRD